MDNVVAVVRGNDKLSSFDEVIALAGFESALSEASESSGKNKRDFRIVIKPNMMVYVNPRAYEPLVTDKDLVERLVDRILDMGYRDVAVCEAQNDVGRMLKNHNVEFVSKQIGYDPRGRYRIVDLTNEAVTHRYAYRGARGKIKHWKDKVGLTWRDADFRITFAKCKTHEHDWMTLGVKNVYGCFPRADKVCRYHIRYEVADVTARSFFNFPVHFSFVDGWVASDGFQGYKIARPQELKMLFGGNNAVAVDVEVFKRAGLEPCKSMILKRVVEQLYRGVYPRYAVKGDEDTQFSQLCAWDNVEDEIVEAIDVVEEVYVAWSFINLVPAGTVVDYDVFPPKDRLSRFLVWIVKKLYAVFKLTRLYRRLYGRRS